MERTEILTLIYDSNYNQRPQHDSESAPEMYYFEKQEYNFIFEQNYKIFKKEGNEYHANPICGPKNAPESNSVQLFDYFGSPKCENFAYLRIAREKCSCR